MRARLCLALVALAALAAAPRAQTTLVRLDIHATSDGRPVEDLTVGDLDVVEDSAPQTIESLTHADKAKRPFVVFLDTPHMRFEGARDVRVALVRFLDRLLDEDDLVGLATPDISPTDIEFRTKADVIPALMQDERLWERARVGSRDAKEDRYAQCFPANQYREVAAEMQERHREQVTLDAFDRLVDVLGARGTRTAVLTLTDGWRLFAPNPRLGGNVSSSRGGLGGFGGFGGRGRSFPPPDDGRDVSGVSRTECDADRMTLAAMDNTRRLDRIADAANRALVSFYPIYARAIAAQQTASGRPPAVVADEEQDPASRMDAMRQIAANTDGLAVMTTSAIDSALTRIGGDMGSYDVITYRSTNNRLDGKFRSVTVRSLRPGVTIRARRGYRGASVDDVLGPDTSTGADSAFGSVAALSPRANFRIRTSLARTTDAADATLWVVGELDYRARREVAWTAGAVADVTIVGSDGEEVLARSIDVPSNASSFAVRGPDAGGIHSGEYAVRVRLRPNNPDGMPVTDTARVTVPRTLPPLGDSILWRRGPSTGPQYVITADPRFRRNERLRVEIPTTTTGTPGARMLDRAGKPNRVPVTVSERADETGQFRWIVAEAVLAPLAAGDYAIETTLGDEKQVTAFQLVP